METVTEAYYVDAIKGGIIVVAVVVVKIWYQQFCALCKL